MSNYIDHYWIANQVTLGDGPYFVAVGKISERKVDATQLDVLKEEARCAQAKHKGLNLVIVHEVKQFKSKPSKIDGRTGIPIV